VELELAGESIVEVPPSRTLRLLRSPSALGAAAVLYTVMPSLAPASGDGAANLRILAASGALLGAIPVLALARRSDRVIRAASVLAGSTLGAIITVLIIAIAQGESPQPSDLVSWALLYPALAYASAVMLALLALDILSPVRAPLPTAAALLLAAFGLVPLGNALTATRAAEWYPYMGFYWAIGGGALWLLLLALARWFPASTDRVIDGVGDRVMRMPTPVFLALAAGFALVASALLAIWCFGRQPHNADEVAQLWHARILLSGHLSLPADVNSEFFGMDNVIDDGRWYSQFPIGGPAFLAVGLAARAAWLLNPVLLAFTLVNIHRFARAAYDETTARTSALVFALSPFALFMGASFMNHVPVLWLVSVALVQLTVWSEARQRAEAFRAAALIGLAMGVAATVRPLDAVLAAAVIGAMQLTRLRDSGARRQSLFVQALCGAVPLTLLLVANARTTGSPFRFGYDVMYGSAHGLGFHMDPYGTVHTPVRALMYASKYLLQLNMSLLEAPLPAVGFIVAGLLFLRRPSRWDRLLLALVGAQLLGYALYWHEGDFRGPRFLFSVMPALVILVARAPVLIAAATHGAARRAALLILPACVLVAWLAYGTENSVAGRVRGYHGAPITGRVDPDSVARQAGLHHALVFVSENFEARALRRLWAFGIPRGTAMRLMVTVNPCALRVALEGESHRAGSPAERLDRILRAQTDGAPDGQMSGACLRDLMNGGDGAASYAPFYPANRIGPDGRIGGDVIYAMDLGEHDEVLRARFGDRTWYRFGPHSSRGDRVPRITPYTRTEP
jgi:hypothetical protein